MVFFPVETLCLKDRDDLSQKIFFSAQKIVKNRPRPDGYPNKFIGNMACSKKGVG